NKLAANTAFMLGNAFFSAGAVGKAVYYYAKAIEYNPELYYAYYNLGITYSAAGNAKKAAETMKRLLELKPDFEKATEAKKIISGAANR
ncbi:MAG TPA: tetratricopeptide repeat protein, partial [Firmicutes bacterium]|nr:tetratricopeptide repeat protein [Bacillota bacterium]